MSSMFNSTVSADSIVRISNLLKQSLAIAELKEDFTLFSAENVLSAEQLDVGRPQRYVYVWKEFLLFFDFYNFTSIY